MIKKELKEELISIVKQSYKERLFVGTSGNLSVYDSENDVMIITPGSFPYETMSVEDLVLMRLNGEIIEGKNNPSSEWRLHAVIYREIEHIKAVVHTHSPYATALSVNNETIPIIVVEMIRFLGGEVNVAKFALPGSEEVGLEAVKALEEKKVCLLANHGVVAVGKSLGEAYLSALYTEDVAKIYNLAMAKGHINVVSEENVTAIKNKIKKRAN